MSTAANDPDDLPLAELVKRLSDQSGRLAQMEIELAKAEMELKAKRIGVGIGAFGGAGVMALLVAAALTATLVLALATALEPWLAALIVTVAYAAIAAVMALAGRRKLQEGTPPVPEQAMESSREDVEAAKHAIEEGRSR